MNLIKLKTLGQLGLANLIRVAWYRASVRAGVNPVHKIAAEIPQLPFLNLSSNDKEEAPWPEANNAIDASIKLFGYLTYSLNRDEIPNWFESPLTHEKLSGGDRNWWQISDFDTGVGDIKQLWELSRFDWVLRLAQLIRFHAGSDPKRSAAYEHQLNQWLADWIEKNPPYKGVNWKCGQEASIRVMHLICAAHILGGISAPSTGLIKLIELHLRRIAPTMSYAVAQDNNHGTSEAAALFVGGMFLAKNEVAAGTAWSKLGRKWLENRVRRLVAKDGTFSQYSVNYHRVMLDTLAFAETARRWLAAPRFSTKFYDRARAATNWLAAMTVRSSGNVPNIGANDGARLFTLTDTDYRDHRPSLIWAYNVFDGSSPVSYFDGADEAATVLGWLALEAAEKVTDLPDHLHCAEGGFAILAATNAKAVIHYPRFRFRPSQNDLLHVDLWVDNENLLRDAGTYSYNCEEPWQSYFPSSAAHNTAQFDDREQMLRISRFLLGAWPKATGVRFDASNDEKARCFACSFRDYLGATHSRRLELNADRLCVTDTVGGFKEKAVIRYRLSPNRHWSISGNIISAGMHTITFSSDVRIATIEIVEGWESRYYFKKSRVPVVEVTLTDPGSLTMEYQWA